MQGDCNTCGNVAPHHRATCAKGQREAGRLFCVMQIRGGLRWSNSQGWVSGPDFDRFTALERETLRLPMGGLWAIIPEGF